MKIQMTHSHYGSQDGFAVEYFHAGKVYQVSDGLAASFLQKGWAFNAEEYDTPTEQVINLLSKHTGCKAEDFGKDIKDEVAEQNEIAAESF